MLTCTCNHDVHYCFYMAHQLHTRISTSLWEALWLRSANSGQSIAHIVQVALAEALDLEHHSIFQVSTSGAIVEGLYQGCVSVADLRRHGDFGLGTFDQLDGEMIMIDGQCFQARSDGSVVEASDDEFTPFAVVTNFHSDETFELAEISSWDQLEAQLDDCRTSENAIVGIRIHGTFESLRVRAACKSELGIDLVAATSSQSEFAFENITGTLVGFWSPGYTRAISIPGYHVHFISDDRHSGGHVLGLSAGKLSVDLHHVSDVHLAIPETQAFLEADLSGDTTQALETAERAPQ